MKYCAFAVIQSSKYTAYGFKILILQNSALNSFIKSQLSLSYAEIQSAGVGKKSPPLFFIGVRFFRADNVRSIVNGVIQ